MPTKSSVDQAIAWIAHSLPGLVRDGESDGRELMQTTTWLVGLATALIGVLFAKESLLAHMPSAQRTWLIALLLFTVIAGVLQRVLYRVLEPKMRLLAFGLQSRLLGLTVETEEPEEFSERWSHDEVIARIGQHFGMDYSGLIREDTPVGAAA